MIQQVRICMLGTFSVTVDGEPADEVLKRSKKGASLMRILILSEGKPVSNHGLLESLWGDDYSSNPESALKTLVSRLRSLLNRVSEGLGGCIVADRGAYHWENRPGVSVDFYEVNGLLNRIAAAKTDMRKLPLYRKLMELYHGKLLSGGTNDWVQARATALHNRYLDAVCDYLHLLGTQEDYEGLAKAARQALMVDDFDDRLHVALMAALLKLNRSSEAMKHYQHVRDLHFRYLGVLPSSEILSFYEKIVSAGRAEESRFDLEEIRRDLKQENETGAQVYEYAVFRNLYNMALEGAGDRHLPAYLGALMIGMHAITPVQTARREDLMNSLLEIVRSGLSSGDMITRYAPSVLLVMICTAEEREARNMLENIRRRFQHKYQNAGLTLSCQIGPLAGERL